MTFEYFNDNATNLAKQGGLTGKELSTFLISALQIFMQTDAEKEINQARINAENTNTTARITAETAMNQARIDAEAGVRTADIALITSKKAMFDQQKLSEIERTQQETYRTDVLLADEHSLNLAKRDLMDKQAVMTVRQTTGFDDRKNTDKAKLAEELVSAVFLSGGTAPVDSWTWSKGLVDSL